MLPLFFLPKTSLALFRALPMPVSRPPRPMDPFSLSLSFSLAEVAETIRNPYRDGVYERCAPLHVFWGEKRGPAVIESFGKLRVRSLRWEPAFRRFRARKLHAGDFRAERRLTMGGLFLGLEFWLSAGEIIVMWRSFDRISFQYVRLELNPS